MFFEPNAIALSVRLIVAPTSPNLCAVAEV